MCFTRVKLVVRSRRDVPWRAEAACRRSVQGTLGPPGATERCPAQGRWSPYVGAWPFVGKVPPSTGWSPPSSRCGTRTAPTPSHSDEGHLMRGEGRRTATWEGAALLGRRCGRKEGQDCRNTCKHRQCEESVQKRATWACHVPRNPWYTPRVLEAEPRAVGAPMEPRDARRARSPPSNMPGPPTLPLRATAGPPSDAARAVAACRTRLNATIARIMPRIATCTCT